MEPDPEYLEIGKRNLAFNGLAAVFVHGAIGPEPGRALDFTAESTGAPVKVIQQDLGSLMSTTGLDRVSLLMVDIQGFETTLLKQAAELLRSGVVRFAIVSTHHHQISGDPLTHQRALALLLESGAHVVAEHTVGESFSGDGLIAVSFDERDRGMDVPLSRARAKESLFGELEYDLQHALDEAGAARAELEAVKGSRWWRVGMPFRAVGSGVRALARHGRTAISSG
jgi:hypothetical protein